MISGIPVRAKIREYAASSMNLTTREDIFSAMVVYGFATLSGDTDTMLSILEYAHNTKIPLLSYSNETDLTAVVNLVYLSARDSYRIEREDKAGIGYVDFIFYPRDKKADGIILELKVDHTPEEAIQQIKDRKYALRFQGKLAETAEYQGRILAVGIAFVKKSKKHGCRTQVLRERLSGFCS